jgi:hypothetical protein
MAGSLVRFIASSNIATHCLIGNPSFDGFALPESGLATHADIRLGKLASTYPSPKRPLRQWKVKSPDQLLG